MYTFIGGTQVAGKSYSSKKFVENSGLNITLIKTDALRLEMINDPKLRKWINVFWDRDEHEFWQNTNYEDYVQLLVGQSEAFFPIIMKTVNKIMAERKHAIFEGVNLLPHLVNKHISFPALFLVCDDRELIFSRLKEHPRWGGTEQFQRTEAEYIVKYDTRFIREEAIKFGYKVFNNPSFIEQELGNIFGMSGVERGNLRKEF
mgnify:FL=1